MRAIRQCVLSLSAAAVFGLSTPAARAIDSDLAQSKTYTWVVATDSVGHRDPMAVAQVKQAIDAQLAARGLTKTDGRSDLVLAYQVDVQREQFSIAQGSDMGIGGGGGVRMAVRTSPATETLRVYVYDAATGQLVWQSTATKPLDDHSNPQKRQKNITKAVAKLLKKFPWQN